MPLRTLTAHIGACLLAASMAIPSGPAAARLWKPTPDQQTADYLALNHFKGAEGRVVINWLAAPAIPAPALRPLLEKYVVVSIVHIRQGANGTLTWDDIQGVQASDGSGQALKEVPKDSQPPTLIGVIAASEASTRQTTQGNGKIYWGVWEAGSIAACQKGRLVITYDGEAYSFDTPLPNCPKP